MCSAKNLWKLHASFPRPRLVRALILLASFTLTSCGGGGDEALDTGGKSESDADASDAETGSGPTKPESSPIETVSMRSASELGAGGFLYTVFYPVVLLKDGSACLDSNFLASDLSPDEHRTSKPMSWTTWTETNGKLTLQNGTAISGRYGAAAKGLRLDDTFTKTGGGGNTAVGGSTIILTQNTYRFLPSGRFVQGSFVGFSSEGAAGTSVPADQAGTYEINGYQLTLRYDSGTSVVKSFVAGKPAGEILWIGGATFLAESTR